MNQSQRDCKVVRDLVERYNARVLDGYKMDIDADVNATSNLFNMFCDDDISPCVEIRHTETKSGYTELFEFLPSLEELCSLCEVGLACLDETCCDGTVQLWQVLSGPEYVVLEDNTVISREEDNDSERSFFSYY